MIDATKSAALELLLANSRGDYDGLPRTAATGYPEPYTRDLMLASLGMLIMGDDVLVGAVRRVLESLATNQTRLGLIPGLAHDPGDLGSSDTTPLFLIGLALYRETTGQPRFLSDAADRALTWLRYQSPDGSGLVAQQPTSDWRDEHWVPGFGLYVNALVYAALRLWGRDDEAESVRRLINRPVVTAGWKDAHDHEGLALPDRPAYALWSYKVHFSDRFDLLGNALAILFGIAPRERASALIDWVEAECEALSGRGELAVRLPPVLFPYIRATDPDWMPRYERFNQPGEYHNGGLWPFCIGFYIAALVAAGRHALAEEKLTELTDLVQAARGNRSAPGFNEWHRAQDGAPRGQDGQTWSAALYFYAAQAVHIRRTPFFDQMRGG